MAAAHTVPTRFGQKRKAVDDCTYSALGLDLRIGSQGRCHRPRKDKLPEWLNGILELTV